MKFRKYFKIKYKGNNCKQYNSLLIGNIGLKALSHSNITSEQISSVIKSLKRTIKKKNFLVVHTMPFWSLTQKPRDVRMGRGKGTPALKIFPLKAGKIILELKNVDNDIAKRALKFASLKLPVLSYITKCYDKCPNSIKSSW